MAKQLKNMMGAGLGAQTAKLINGVVFDGLTATGSTQADALPLPGDVNVVGTVPSGTGVILPSVPQPGDEIVISNLGANALNVYPSIGGTVQGSVANAAYSLASGAAASFIARRGSQNWVVLSSSPGGVVPIASPMALGFNMPTLHWYDANRPFLNLLWGNEWTNDTNADVPRADLTNGWITSNTGGATSFTKLISLPKDITKTFKMTWSGSTGLDIVGGGLINKTTIGPNEIHFQLSKGLADLPATDNTRINYAASILDITNIDIRETDADPAAVWNPDFLATLVGLQCVRWMQSNIVDANISPVSWTGRNVMGGGEYIGYNGIPVEVMVDLANTAAIDQWGCIQLEADDTYVTNYATYIKNNLSAGRKFYVEFVNEAWNSGEAVLLTQMQVEGLASGYASVNGVTISSITFSGTTATVTTASPHGMTGTGFNVTVTGASPSQYNVSKAQATVTDTTHFTYTMGGTPATNATVVGSYTQINRYTAGLYRYAERAAQVMSLFYSVFTTPTDQARIVRVFGMQNAGPSSMLPMFDWVHPTLGLISNYFDAIAVAPYPGSGITIGSGTTADAFFAALPGDTASVYALTAQHKANAVARSKRLITYEHGVQVLLSPADLTKSLSIAHDDRWYSYIKDTFIPGYFEVNNDLSMVFINPNRIFDTVQWGFTEYMGQTISRATTPKMQGLRDRISAGLQLTDQVATLTIPTGAANGTVAGTLSPSLYGSTFASLNSFGLSVNASTGAVTVADNTKLPAVGSGYTVTCSETNALATNSPHTTNVPLTVTAAWAPTSPAQAIAAYYDVSDISTLFKDTAGTVPVTADGDLVKCIKDKSGNAADAVAQFGDAGYVYHAGGGKPYLQNDGTHFLTTNATFAVTDASGQHSAGAAVWFDNNTGTQRALDATGTNTVSQLLRNNAGTAETIAFSSVGGAMTDSGAAISTSASCRLVEVTSTASNEIWVNGSSGGGSAIGAALEVASASIGVGVASGLANQMTGRFYAGIIYKGPLGSTDRNGLDGWLAAKMP